MVLAGLLAQAGAMAPARASEIQRQADRREAVAGLQVRVQESLRRARRTGRPEDWAKYAQLRRRLPRHLQLLN